MDTNVKTEDDYYEGPPPPDEIPSNKPLLQSNRVTPMKSIPDNQATTSDDMPTKTLSATIQSRNKSSVQKKGEKSFFVSKIISKKDNKTKERDLTLKVNALVGYTKVNDDPQRQQIASEVLESDLLFLEIKEVDDDDIEPVYEVFGEGEPLCKDHADIVSEWKVNNNCDDCYADCCDEWRFGEYCVQAVKRYWNENSHSATIKGAYTTFVAHYNRVLDWHSFGEGDTHRLRPTKVTQSPHCMRKGSLLFAIQWIKWKIENDALEKDFYDDMRKRRKIDVMEKERERELRKKEFKPRKKSYRYSAKGRK